VIDVTKWLDPNTRLGVTGFENQLRNSAVFLFAFRQVE